MKTAVKMAKLLHGQLFCSFTKGWGGPQFNPAGRQSKIHSVLTKFHLVYPNLEITGFKEWMNSYKPTELFNADGSLRAELLTA